MKIDEQKLPAERPRDLVQLYERIQEMAKTIDHQAEEIRRLKLVVLRLQTAAKHALNKKVDTTPTSGVNTPEL